MLKVEMKKFINPILLFVAVLISCVFYYMDISFIYNNYPNGAGIELYDYSLEWHDRFGTSMSDDDFLEVEQENQERIKEADEIVLRSDYGKKRQLTSLEELNALEEHLPSGRIDEMSQKEQEEWQELSDLKAQPIFNKIEAYSWIQEGLERYTSEKAFYKERYASDKTKALINQTVFEEESWRNILPDDFTGTVSSTIGNILVLGIVVMALILPAPFVRDNLLKIKSLQWSSKKGRSLVATQYIVTQIGSFLILTGVLSVFLLPLTQTNLTRFFSSGLNSFLTESFGTSEYSVFSFTVSQWVWLLILMAYLVGLSFSNILFFIAQKSENYLSLLLKVIPLLTVFIILGQKIIGRAFFIQNDFYKMTEILWIEIIVSVVLFILGTVIGIQPIKKSKKQDLLI